MTTTKLLPENSFQKDIAAVARIEPFSETSLAQKALNPPRGEGANYATWLGSAAKSIDPPGQWLTDFVTGEKAHQTLRARGIKSYPGKQFGPDQIRATYAVFGKAQATTLLNRIGVPQKDINEAMKDESNT